MKNTDISYETDYRRVEPDTLLSDIVESIWLQHQQRAPGHRLASTVIPTGTVELLFHYGDRIMHFEEDECELMPRSYVTGQRSRPVNVIGIGRLQAVIVSLFPWGLKTLFPQVPELTDGYVDLNLLDASGQVERLQDQPYLIREMQRFTGTTPARIAPDPAPGKSTFNGNDVSDFFDTVYI